MLSELWLFDVGKQTPTQDQVALTLFDAMTHHQCGHWEIECPFLDSDHWCDELCGKLEGFIPKKHCPELIKSFSFVEATLFREGYIEIDSVSMVFGSNDSAVFTVYNPGERYYDKNKPRQAARNKDLLQLPPLPNVEARAHVVY